MWKLFRSKIAGILRTCDIDIIHCHGIDYHRYLPDAGPPVLATLHMPIEWYAPEALAPRRPGIWLHGVSAVQPIQGPHVLPPIENGVSIESLASRHSKRRFALMLSRICAEKGVHLAIDAARKAHIPLLIGGQIFPYGPHLRYFEQEVQPRLDARRRFIGPVQFAKKRRLLTAAQCLLVPSVIPETSSLVAREALVCGTPVIGFPHGALPDLIEQGRTGFLVNNVDEMADAIQDCRGLDPEVCREIGQERFSEGQMTEQYLARYQLLAQSGRDQIAS
jgi:glycosyltransferase involved in cell wall biosynthesis